jgi:hypothetical protein
MALTTRKPTQELIDLVGTLRGNWHGNTAMCRCPAHGDNTPSLSIRQGDRGILVTCFAGCDREDVLRELGRIPINRSFPPPEFHQPRLGNVERLWREARPVHGTLGERYLERRNILPVADDIRFHPRCPYLPRPKTVFLPALLIAVREIRSLVAVQRIILDPDTANYRMKVMLGTPGRGAWKGGGGGNLLAIGEGFETARAFTLIHGIPCWASLGARRLDQLLLPTSITKLLIAEDNDSEGGNAARKAIERYTRDNLEICRVPPPLAFKDWAKANDALCRG